jgi:hypothetical protein
MVCRSVILKKCHTRALSAASEEIAQRILVSNEVLWKITHVVADMYMPFLQIVSGLYIL